MRAVLRWLLVAAGTATCASCLPLDEEYTCTSHDACVRDGEQGTCEREARCAFPDEACPITKRRFGAHAGDLSDSCVVTGIIYWASPDGDDANPGTEQLPFRSVHHGASVLAPGDGLLVKPGTYPDGVLLSTAGSSWELPITISAWPRREATLHSEDPERRALEFVSPARFVVVDGLVIDGTGGTHEPVKTYADHVRLRDCEVFGSPVVGISLSGEPGTAGLGELIDLDVHGNGTSLETEETGSPSGGIVASTANNLIQGCRIYDNIGVGIMFYTEAGGVNGNVVRNNVVSGGVREDAPGIFMASGNENVAYNNVIHAVSGPGIRLDYGAVDCRLLHNTVHGSVGLPLQIGPTGVSGVIARNNVLFRPDFGEDEMISDEGASSTLEANLRVDPMVVDAAGDFHLQPGSPAIDQGITEPEVTVDFDGIARPRGAAYDMGAFER